MEFLTCMRVLKRIAGLTPGTPVRLDDWADLEPAAFRRFLRSHQLRIFVYETLGAAGVRELFPDGFVRELERHAGERRVRHDALLDLAAEVQHLLGAARIPTMLLKGPYVGQRFYGARHRRHQDDVDVLVPVDALEQSVALLVARGFESPRMSRISAWETDRFEYSWSLSAHGQKLDLHARLRYRPAFRVDYEALWDARQPVVVDGLPFCVLSDEHALMFLLVTIVDDIERGAAKMKYFLDLLLVLRSIGAEFDWPGFLVRRKAERTDRICLNALEIFVRAFDCREEFPGLASVLDAQPGALNVASDEAVVTLLCAPRRSVANRVWFARIYPSSALRYCVWLLIRSGWRHLALYERLLRR